MTSRTEASSSTIRMRVGAARVSTKAILGGLLGLDHGGRVCPRGRVDSREGDLSSNSRPVPTEWLEGQRRCLREDGLGKKLGRDWGQKDAIAEMSAGEEQTGKRTRP